MLVGSEGNAVRELNSLVDQVDLARRDVDAIDASVVGKVAPVGVELAAGRERLEFDAGIGEVQVAVGREGEIVQEQEGLAAAFLREDDRLPIERELEQRALQGLRNPDRPVPVARQPVRPSGLRHRAARGAVRGDVRDPAAIRAHLDEQETVVGQHHRRFRENRDPSRRFSCRYLRARQLVRYSSIARGVSSVEAPGSDGARHRPSFRRTW